MTIQQSFSFDGFVRTGIDPIALIRGAAEIGYGGVELVEPELWPVIRDHGLRIVSIAGHPLSGAGLNSSDADQTVKADIINALKLAEQWDIPYVLCFSGNRNSRSPQEAVEIVAGNLQSLAPAFERAGVTLVMELLNSKVPNRDYLADHTGWAATVVDMVGSPRVRLLYDIFHMQIMEGDLIHTIGEHNSAIAHYHTAGNPGRADLDDDQEINYAAVIKAIAKTGHSGFIGHEFFPKHDAITSLRGAFELCQRAIESDLQPATIF